MCPERDPVHQGGPNLNWDVVLYWLVVQWGYYLAMYQSLSGLNCGESDT